MKTGPWNVYSILEGTFGLDGGSMFGIVPKPLWSKHHEPDDKNRITMALRPMLITNGDRHILVDAGIGSRFDEKQQKIYHYLPAKPGLLEGIERLGLTPRQITDVIATHLHFDHVSGLLAPDDEGQLLPVFPNAKIHIQEEAWRWAKEPSQWDRGSFFKNDFSIWENELALSMLHGDTEIAPDVRVMRTQGHTPGHQVVLVGQGKDTVVFCADLIPTAAHLNLAWIMAYDQNPLMTLDEKKMLLAQAVEENWILVFEHDPHNTACRLKEEKNKVMPGERMDMEIP